MIKINKSMYEKIIKEEPSLVIRTKNGYYVLGSRKFNDPSISKQLKKHKRKFKKRRNNM